MQEKTERTKKMKTPFITKAKAEEIIKEIPTPFHIYDEEGIRENEKLTEDETFTISATGTHVKSVTQNLLAAVSGTSAPTGASFDIKA